MLLLFAITGCREDSNDSGGTASEGLQLSAVQTCEAPRPLSYAVSGAGLITHEDLEAEHLNGGGLVIEDLDSDGALDFMVFFSGSAPGTYLGDGAGGFTEHLGTDPTGGMPSLIDLDRDGHLDIVLSGHKALHSDGAGGMTSWDGALSLEGGVLEGKSQSLRVGDLDGDGFGDLLMVRSSSEGDLDKNRDAITWGGATVLTLDLEAFEQSSASRQGFDAQILDWDGDGDLDIYIINDMGNQYGGNVLWQNDDGVFTDISEACGCGVVMSGMGASAGDYNADGILDLYLTATSQNLLLEVQADRTVVDVTAATGANPLTELEEMTWGSAWLDHDNDGDLDVIALQGDLWSADMDHSTVYDAPMHLLSQDGGTFTDVAADLGMTQLGSFRSVGAAELNGDGVLDLVVTQVTDHPWVFLSEGCTENAWLEVVAPEHSRVEVVAGGATQTAVVMRGTGFAYSGPDRVWLGLGGAERIERLTITTLDGAVFSAVDFEPRRRATAQP